MTITGTSIIWFALTFLFLGTTGGVIIGVVIDRDTVVNQIFKRIRYKKGTGDLILNGSQEIPEKKTWRQRLKERK